MPTFIDMSIDLEHITMADVIHDDNWVSTCSNGLLGNILNLNSENLARSC